MTDDELNSRIEALESRFLHQDAALEELTRILMSQEQLLKQQTETIKRLEMLLHTLTPSPIATSEEETPPTHY